MRNPNYVDLLPSRLDVGTKSLTPKVISQDNHKLLESINSGIGTLSSTNTLERGLIGRSLLVGTTPVKLVKAEYLRGYIFKNANESVGIASTGVILGSALRAASSITLTTGAPLGTASYKTLSLFLNITATGGGTVQVDALSRDPLSGLYADTQLDLFALPSAIGTYYANLGSLGVDTDFAVRVTVSAGGSSTFSLAFSLKDGLPGSNGLSNTLYLGNSGVTVVTGYPLISSQERQFYLKQNTELWAVSLISDGIEIRVFEL